MNAIIAMLGGVRGTIFAGLALVLLLAFAWGRHQLSNEREASAKYRAQIVEQTLLSEQKARRIEQHHAAALNAVARAHQEDLRNAQATYDRTVADVRSGALKLQDRWACPAANVSRPATRPSVPNGAADDRAESAARIVQASAECDAQIRGLQAVTQADRVP